MVFLEYKKELIAFLDTRWFHGTMTTYKVLYIAPTVGIGGVETFIKHVSHCHSGAFEPSFLLFQKGPLGDWLKANNATVHYCTHTPRLSRPWTWFLYARELLCILKDQNIDLAHSSMAYAALFSWPAVFFKKHIWFQHGPVSGWMDKLAYKLPSSAVLYNSHHTYKKQTEKNPEALLPGALAHFIIPLGTPQLTTNSLSVSKTEWLKEYNLPENTLVITMANRLQRWKGVHITITAYKQLLKQTKTPTALFVFAEPSWDLEYEKELRLMAQDLTVFFCKPVADLSPVLAVSDIVVNASTTAEPFGLTLIEAMSASVVPVAAWHGGPVEILSDELKECGFTPSDPQSLATTLLALVSDPLKMKHLKKRSFERYLTNYKINHMIENLESCYLKVLETKT